MYNIIHFTSKISNNKVQQSYFSNLGDNNPNNLINAITTDDYYTKLLYKNIIFHDQEPIFYRNYKKDWDEKIYFFNKIETNHILSNSEKNSLDKAELLDKSKWHDFYWFSNGFMSLEWFRYYRYAEFLEKNWCPSKTFSSYNRIFDNRTHRLHISQFLYKHFANKIILSCHFNDSNKESQDLFINTKNKKNQNLSFNIDVEDFMDSFCHVTTERIFYEERIHLTEKVFKPIVCCRPFILVSSPKSLQYLKDYGFKTFSDFWPEEYDSIIDHEQRLDCIFDLINFIGSLSHTKVLDMLTQMKEILIYNRNHFYSNFRDIITNELYENLTHALTATNNNDGYYQKILNSLSKSEYNILANWKTFDNDDDMARKIFVSSINLEKAQDDNLVRPFVLENLDYFKHYYAHVDRLQKGN